MNGEYQKAGFLDTGEPIVVLARDDGYFEAIAVSVIVNNSGPNDRRALGISADYAVINLKRYIEAIKSHPPRNVIT